MNSGFDDQLIHQIMNRTGYSYEDAKRYIQDENYKRIIEEQNLKLAKSTTGSISAKNNVQPSCILSIASSLNQSNISNNFNNTQPLQLSTNMDRLNS